MLNSTIPHLRCSRLGQSKDLGRGMLSNDHDSSGGVAGDMTRENGSIHDEQVVGAIHLGVSVDDGRSAAASVISAHLDSACDLLASTLSINRKNNLPIQWLEFRDPGLAGIYTC